MEDEELTQIVKRVQDDKGQFESLYPEIINKVYYWCYMILGNRSDADDACQEAIIRIYSKIDTLKNTNNINSWIYRVTTNSCYNIIRSKKRTDSQIFQSDHFSEDNEVRIPEKRSAALPKEMIAKKERKEVIISCVSKLPRKQREVITLFYLEEFTTKEVASILNCSIGNVKVQLHKGRKNLKNHLVEYQDNHDLQVSDLSIILTGVLKEHCQDLVNKQKFPFHESIKKQLKPYSLTQQSLSFLSNNVWMLVSIVTVLAVTSVVVLSNTDSTSEKTSKGDILTDLKKWDDVKGYQWIHTVSYDQNLTKNDVLLSINLQKEVEAKDIRIIFKNQEMNYEMSGKRITVWAKENGKYEIYVKNELADVEIQNIDEKAPEVLEIIKQSSSITLDIKDEYQTIDYEKSYILYKEETYAISTEHTVPGNFEGEVLLVLYNKKGQCLQYTAEIK